MPDPQPPRPKAAQLGWPALWRSVVLQTAVLTAVAGALSCVVITWNLRWRPPGTLMEIPVKEARARMTDFVWVDVRNPERFESAHIPGAIHFNETETDVALNALRQEWKTGKKLIVYGEGTGSERAQRVARLLRSHFATRDVYLLEGGWASWPLP